MLVWIKLRVSNWPYMLCRALLGYFLAPLRASVHLKNSACHSSILSIPSFVVLRLREATTHGLGARVREKRYSTKIPVSACASAFDAEQVLGSGMKVPLVCRRTGVEGSLGQGWPVLHNGVAPVGTALAEPHGRRF